MSNTEASAGSTLMDDSVAEVGRTEEQLLADIVRNSNFVEPLPNEQVPELDPEESETEDPDVSEEAVSEEVEEESEEDIVEETDEDAAEVATQESDIYAIEDLDMDAKVVIKIDGEETEVPFSDLIKGYSTEQHLSKKGRELGDARKGLEEEFQTKMGQVEQLSQASIAVLYSSEQSHSKAYHDIEGQIEEARKSDDTYTVNELKDKREIIQKKYWQARNQREQLVNSVTAQTNEQKIKIWNDQLKIFNDTIPDLIPGFNAEIAKDIREFAIKEGIPAEVLDTIADPIIVKFVDDYRKLKQGISKGTAKRKLTTSSKAPLRKNSPATKKKKDAAELLRSKTLSGKASEAEQKDFLRGLAQRSLNL